jgi:hypothetical protein
MRIDAPVIRIKSVIAPWLGPLPQVPRAPMPTGEAPAMTSLTPLALKLKRSPKFAFASA